MNRWEKVGIVSTLGLAAVIAILGVGFFIQPELLLKNQASNTPLPEQKTQDNANASPPTKEDVAVVTYNDQNGFTPKTITIQKGETVQFKNERDGRPMWVASDPHPAHTDYQGFDTAKILGRFSKPGEDFSFTFEKIGTWKYHDHADPGKTGTIIVQ